MLKPAKEFEPIIQLSFLLTSIIAWDEETGITLRVSRGFSKRGRPPEYFIQGFNKFPAPTVRAWTNTEAIQAANMQLERLNSDYKPFNRQHYTICDICVEATWHKDGQCRRCEGSVLWG